MSTAIAPWGNSDAVRIPREILRLAGLRRGDTVTPQVNERGNIELVSDGERHRSFSDAPFVSMDTLFATYSGDYVPHEADWGKDVGSEVVA